MTFAIQSWVSPISPIAVPADPIWRLSVAQYQQMVDSDILTDDDPVELLEGWLVSKMPKNPSHTLTTQLVRDLLTRLAPANWFINDQEPITTGDSVPEPDIAIVRGVRHHYSTRHPTAQDVALVIEVADATLQRDRTIKQRLYARAGIAVYWIINLVDREIEVYTLPDQHTAAYRQCNVYQIDDAVAVVVEGEEIGRIVVRDVLPPA